MKTRQMLALVACAGTLVATSASAETLRFLSTGAVETGVRAVAEPFTTATGHRLDITTQTAPEVAARLAAGEAWDLVIATPATIEQYTKSGLLAPGSVPVGRVGVGIAVRTGSPRPDVSSVESLRRAVLDAQAIHVSRGSTGRYAEELLRKLGLFTQVEARIVRSDRGAMAMERLSQEGSRSLAFGALTEIADSTGIGIELVAPLPEEIQNYTEYVLARSARSAHPQATAAFLAHVGSAGSRDLLAKAGIGR